MWPCFTFFKNLFNARLNGRQLGSHICSRFNLFLYVVLIDLYEENQASHRYVVGKRGPDGLWISGHAARKKRWGSGGEAKSTVLGWGVWTHLGGCLWGPTRSDTTEAT